MYYFQVFFNVKITDFALGQKTPQNTTTKLLKYELNISLQNVKNPEVRSAQGNDISDFTAFISKTMRTI